MVIKHEHLNRKERIARLFREAIEAENRNDLETAKRKLDEILHESVGKEPELYFEACFRLANIFLQEDNYRGAVKCALRAIYNAPSDDLFRLGFKRLKDMLAITKEAGKSLELTENMDSIKAYLKEDELLSSFLEALIKTAKGEEISVEFPVKEMNEALKALKG